MAIIQLQLRQGPEADRLKITPLTGEIIYITDTKALYVGDGSTAGGVVPRIPMPSAGIGENSTYPASTAFVHSLMASLSGVATTGFATKAGDNVFTGLNTFQQHPVISATALPITDSSTKIATTAWVKSLTSGLDVSNFALKNGINSFTNFNEFALSPTVPHPAFNDSSTKVPTTKWVKDLITTVGSLSTVSVIAGMGTTVNYSAGTVTLPDGTLVNVMAGSRTFPASGVNYLIVDSNGAVSISTTFPTQSNIGVLGTVYTSGGLISNISTSGHDLSKYASLDGATFTGVVSAPTPVSTEDSTRLATTEWVNNLVESVLGQDVTGGYATQEWVLNKINEFLFNPIGTSVYPYAYVTSGLNINVTAGTVPKPSGGTCSVTQLAQDLAIDSNSTVYVWVRFSDCRVIATTSPFSSDQGFLLSTATTNASSVTNLSMNTEAVNETQFTRHFRALYDGRLVYVP